MQSSQADFARIVHEVMATLGYKGTDAIVQLDADVEAQRSGMTARYVIDDQIVVAVDGRTPLRFNKADALRKSADQLREWLMLDLKPLVVGQGEAPRRSQT